jgi:hypothetical protein
MWSFSGRFVECLDSRSGGKLKWEGNKRPETTTKIQKIQKINNSRVEQK